jgi:hypothetical protein
MLMNYLLLVKLPFEKIIKYNMISYFLGNHFIILKDNLMMKLTLG